MSTFIRQALGSLEQKDKTAVSLQTKRYGAISVLLIGTTSFIIPTHQCGMCVFTALNVLKTSTKIS